MHSTLVARVRRSRRHPKQATAAHAYVHLPRTQFRDGSLRRPRAGTGDVRVGGDARLLSTSYASHTRTYSSAASGEPSRLGWYFSARLRNLNAVQRLSDFSNTAQMAKALAAPINSMVVAHACLTKTGSTPLLYLLPCCRPACMRRCHGAPLQQRLLSWVKLAIVLHMNGCARLVRPSTE